MPTLFIILGYRFFFLSFDCSEPMHLHVTSSDRTCKFWISPLAIAYNKGFSKKELNQIEKIIVDNMGEIKTKWHEHCKNYTKQKGDYKQKK